jgi:outer membrane autotransporter protein
MTDDLARIIADRTDARLLSLWAEDAGPGTGMWLEVLGGSRAANGHDLKSGGVMAGADHSIGAGHAGGLAGFARGSSRFDSSSEDLTSTSYFGGLYGTYAFESIVLNAALTGGVSSFDGKRDVFDNMASGGTDEVSWQSTGLFASPSITVSLPLDMEAGKLVPSLRGRYGAMRMGSYTEDWASIDLDVDSRMVHLLDVRGQIAWLGSLAAGELGHLDVKLRAGGDLTVSRGGEIQIDLAGTVMDFAAGDDGLETRGFVGFDIGFKPGINTTVSLSGTLGLDQSGALSMDAGLRVARPL